MQESQGDLTTTNKVADAAELARLESDLGWRSRAAFPADGAPVADGGLHLITNSAFRVATVAAEPPGFRSVGKPLLDLVCGSDRHALRLAGERCISADTTEVLSFCLPCAPSARLDAMLWAVDLDDGKGLILRATPTHHEDGWELL